MEHAGTVWKKLEQSEKGGTSWNKSCNKVEEAGSRSSLSFLVPSWSRLFQAVPANSSLFHLVPLCFSLFQSFRLVSFCCSLFQSLRPCFTLFYYDPFFHFLPPRTLCSTLYTLFHTLYTFFHLVTARSCTIQLLLRIMNCEATASLLNREHWRGI